MTKDKIDLQYMVAKAIWAEIRDTDCHDYNKLNDYSKEYADKLADAAITAMEAWNEIISKEIK